MEFNKLIELAKEGNKESLEKIISTIQDNVYGLALRMLYSPADADDAAQEILIKVITNLNSFKGESLFTTWVYRIAANYLMRYKEVEKKYSSTFESYEESLELESSSRWEPAEFDFEDKSYIDEIRISCLQGLLLCLTRELRIAFLLVDIFGVNSTEAAEILEITPVSFRKRLSRARTALQLFLASNCSLVKQTNSCKCGYHASMALSRGGFKKENMVFSTLPVKEQSKADPEILLSEMDELNQIGHLYRTNPDVKAPGKFIDGIKEIIKSDRFTFFNN